MASRGCDLSSPLVQYSLALRRNGGVMGLRVFGVNFRFLHAKPLVLRSCQARVFGSGRCGLWAVYSSGLLGVEASLPLASPLSCRIPHRPQVGIFKRSFDCRFSRSPRVTRRFRRTPSTRFGVLSAVSGIPGASFPGNRPTGSALTSDGIPHTRTRPRQPSGTRLEELRPSLSNTRDSYPWMLTFLNRCSSAPA